jgi:hypothetical protein
VADAPGQTARAAHAHKKKTAKPPKVSLACKTDADCGTTKMADGDCCPSLCQPRVVSKVSAAALAKFAAACATPNGGDCPVPECVPPQIGVAVACVSGKCEARAAPTPGRE